MGGQSLSARSGDFFAIGRRNRERRRIVYSSWGNGDPLENWLESTC
jgi:hypothetical protein